MPWNVSLTLGLACLLNSYEAWILLWPVPFLPLMFFPSHSIL
jgi:hypothetical protein